MESITTARPRRRGPGGFRAIWIRNCREAYGTENSAASRRARRIPPLAKLLLIERCPGRFVFGERLSAQFSEGSVLDRAARAPHEIEVEMQVVNGDQSQPEDFLGLNQVPDIAAREISARRTSAALFDRFLLHREFGVL